MGAGHDQVPGRRSRKKKGCSSMGGPRGSNPSPSSERVLVRTAIDPPGKRAAEIKLPAQYHGRHNLPDNEQRFLASTPGMETDSKSAPSLSGVWAGQLCPRLSSQHLYDAVWSCPASSRCVGKSCCRRPCAARLHRHLPGKTFQGDTGVLQVCGGAECTPRFLLTTLRPRGRGARCPTTAGQFPPTVCSGFCSRIRLAFAGLSSLMFWSASISSHVSRRGAQTCRHCLRINASIAARQSERRRAQAEGNAGVR